MSTSFENNNTSVSLEVEQNVLNKLTTASNRRFFASKVHKLKKMLKPVLKLMSTSRAVSCQESSAPVCCATSAVEDIQNAMNEALEARLSGDVRRPPYNDAALHALANGDIRLIAISCDGTATRVPLHFVCTSSGRYSWTHIPSADNDIRAQGDLYPMSFCQEAEQQTPLCDHSHLQ